ncbi:DUF1810 domain-containing protein [Stakelama saccharophila]|uniref:DUF1810 domain-containing protein n=1 Tax=Stakelama saccharophila TaxID=3075605 RepID=A0ABZ0B940_9SPHN|nr:DUF1810 domain-containing protein [Stakelama sp. W311]WNO53805.1 DUF1810 domain-containing protein [Stakelama sp. W311]
MTADGLDRFVSAQAPAFADALAELAAGRKVGHWMWFVFPQIAGLGLSDTARRYAIADGEEARRYLAHPLLGPRLAEAFDTTCRHAGERSAEAIFGPVDAMKFRSSATLFAVTGSAAAARALNRFFAGEPDLKTLELLGA